MTVQSFDWPARREVAAKAAAVLKTGDILIRRSKTSGPFGIPFSDLVCKWTDSIWSHAALVFFYDGKPWVLEVSDAGAAQMRLDDWLPFCFEHTFVVLRHDQITEGTRGVIEAKIWDYINSDSPYDFTFDDPTRVYCVESVCEIYAAAGLPLMEPMTPKDAMAGHPVAYRAFELGNALIKKMTKRGFALDSKMYFVGNAQKGVLACRSLRSIFQYSE